MSTPAMTLEQAMRRAGAHRLTPDDEPAIYQHCPAAGPMRSEHGLRYVCGGCGITIENAAATRPAHPAPGRHPDGLWIIAQRTPGEAQL